MAKTEMPATGDKTASAMSMPVGMMSPLWMAFGAAAGMGVAYFWMSRWGKFTNLEALMARTSVTPLATLMPAAEPQPLVAPPEDTAADIAFGSSVDSMPHVIAEKAAQAAEAEAAQAEAVAEAVPMAEVIAEAAPVVAEQMEAATETVAEAAEVIADDLTLIVGIGPKLSVALAERGVTSFAQIAKWKARELERVDKALNLKGRAVRDAWVAQAKRFADKATAAPGDA